MNGYPRNWKHYIKINAITKTFVPPSAFVIIFCNLNVLVILLMCIKFIVFAAKTRSLILVFFISFLSTKHIIELYHNHIHIFNLFQFLNFWATQIKNEKLRKTMIRERQRAPLQLIRCYHHFYLLPQLSIVMIKYTFQGYKKNLRKRFVMT